MKPLIYICMLIDAGTVLFLLYALFAGEQDSAGEGMVFLPMILLIGCIAGAWFLMNNGHNGWALFVGGFPVIIIAYLLFISVT
jgi:hypothetical protein